MFQNIMTRIVELKKLGEDCPSIELNGQSLETAEKFCFFILVTQQELDGVHSEKDGVTSDI